MIGISQFQHILAVPLPQFTYNSQTVQHLWMHRKDTNGIALVIGTLTVAFLLGLRKLSKRNKHLRWLRALNTLSTLLVLVASTLASYLLIEKGGQQFPIVGPLPAGSPHFSASLPLQAVRDLAGLGDLIVACLPVTLLAFMVRTVLNACTVYVCVSVGGCGGVNSSLYVRRQSSSSSHRNHSPTDNNDTQKLGTELVVPVAQVRLQIPAHRPRSEPGGRRDWLFQRGEFSDTLRPGTRLFGSLIAPSNQNTHTHAQTGGRLLRLLPLLRLLRAHDAQRAQRRAHAALQHLGCRGRPPLPLVLHALAL